MRDEPREQITVRQVWQLLDELAPPSLAAEWDTAIGLEAGTPDQIVSKVLLTLDFTQAALARALELGCELVITHHPLLFSPLPAIRSDIPEQRLAADLIHSRISLIAAHTNLDAAYGGVADSLADAAGISTIGRQPAGPFGRIGVLHESLQLSQLTRQISKTLSCPACRLNTDEDRSIRRLAVFPGSFSEEEVPHLTELAADAIVCGEIKHHVGLMLAARGIAVIETGHDTSERIVLKPLAARMHERMPQIAFAVYEGLDYNRMAF